MRLLLLIFALLRAESVSASDPILGSWGLEQLFYQGQYIEPFNPDLELLFEFDGHESQRVYWTRKGSPGFCEQRSRYSFDGKSLESWIVWVNPKNAPDCAQDPDMQPGKHTRTDAEIRGGEFWLYLPFGDETLAYIFRPRGGMRRAR